VANQWKWSKAEHLSLSRFVTPESIKGLDIKNHANHLGSPENRRDLLRLIYEALTLCKIDYALPKNTQFNEVQIIRTPLEIMTIPRNGTCLDLTLLFCGVCEAVRLLPCIVVVDGHAFAAVCVSHLWSEWNNATKIGRSWGADRSSGGVLKDPAELISAIKAQKFLAIECTGFASGNLSQEHPEGRGRQNGFLSFERALEAGQEHLTPECLSRRGFQFAVHLGVARNKWQCAPAPQHESYFERIEKIRQVSLAFLKRIKKKAAGLAATLLIFFFGNALWNWYIARQNEASATVTVEILAEVLTAKQDGDLIRLGKRVAFDGIVDFAQATAVPAYITVRSTSTKLESPKCFVFLKKQLDPETAEYLLNKGVKVSGTVANDREYLTGGSWSVSNAEIAVLNE